jgi:hypothetical protein
MGVLTRRAPPCLAPPGGALDAWVGGCRPAKAEPGDDVADTSSPPPPPSRAVGVEGNGCQGKIGTEVRGRMRMAGQLA